MHRSELITQIHNTASLHPRRSVLLLDQSYQPVRAVSWKKATDLVIWREKAEPVLFYDDEQHIHFLSVIRLLYRTIAHSIRHRKLRFDRKHMYMRDDYTCQYCGKNDRRILTIDHVVPRCKGGRTTFQNCVTACGDCNNKKAGRTPVEANMPLLKIPAVPIIGSVVNKHAAPEEWRPFLR